MSFDGSYLTTGHVFARNEFMKLKALLFSVVINEIVFTYDTTYAYFLPKVQRAYLKMIKKPLLERRYFRLVFVIFILVIIINSGDTFCKIVQNVISSFSFIANVQRCRIISYYRMNEFQRVRPVPGSCINLNSSNFQSKTTNTLQMIPLWD